MKIDLDVIARTYFWFDKAVPYKLNNDNVLYIQPVKVKDSEMFLSWLDILTIDKNALPNPTYISMSYLEFIVDTLLTNQDETISQTAISKLVCICKLCLGWDGSINIRLNDRNKPLLCYGDIEISGKQFEDIKNIILYQNIFDYDDSYINPDIKQAIEEVNSIKNRDIDFPTLERRMAIVSSHTGILKKDQEEMTYRSHCVLFKEICGEVDFISVRTAVMVGNMFSKQKIDLEDWIYKKKHNKYEQYFTSQDSYKNSMGGSTNIKSSISDSNMSLDLNSLNL